MWGVKEFLELKEIVISPKGLRGFSPAVFTTAYHLDSAANTYRAVAEGAKII